MDDFELDGAFGEVVGTIDGDADGYDFCVVEGDSMGEPVGGGFLCPPTMLSMNRVGKMPLDG